MGCRAGCCAARNSPPAPHKRPSEASRARHARRGGPKSATGHNSITAWAGASRSLGLLGLLGRPRQHLKGGHDAGRGGEVGSVHSGAVGGCGWVWRGGGPMKESEETGEQQLIARSSETALGRARGPSFCGASRIVLAGARSPPRVLASRCLSSTNPKASNQLADRSGQRPVPCLKATPHTHTAAASTLRFTDGDPGGRAGPGARPAQRVARFGRLPALAVQRQQHHHHGVAVGPRQDQVRGGSPGPGRRSNALQGLAPPSPRPASAARLPAASSCATLPRCSSPPCPRR